MDLLDKIEIYSAMPYEGSENQTITDWFHVALNEEKEHIEAVWNIELIFRPEVDIDEKPTPLIGLESFFEEIRLHYALNYIAQRYHQDLMIWAMKALKPGGKLQIISPDADWILLHWISDAINLNIEEYIMTEKPENKIKFGEVIRKMLRIAKIPENNLPEISHEDLANEVTDRINKERPVDYDFDLWLMQQLYSSGVGEPQDSFKSIFGKRYLSVLLRRNRFVITSLQNNSQTPKQIEVKAIKHQSRLMSNENGVKIL